MKADHRKELEQNTLAKDAELLVEGVKTGKILDWVNYKIVGLIVAILLVGGVWWYAVRESRKSTSEQWATLAGMRSPSALVTFADANQKDTAGKVARLEVARNQFGPEGVAQLRARDPEKRTKGIESIEKSRDEFVKLAEEFKSDKTLRTSCLISAAEAELSLVGIPKAAGSLDSRGEVSKAVEFYKQAANTIGADSDYGKKLTEKAAKLEKDAAEVLSVARVLYNPLSPTTDPHGFGTPKAPNGLFPSIPTPKPPTESPKAPDKIGQPPAVAPTPPTNPSTPAPPAPTPTTPATKK